jgi:hypothetical protein
MLKKKENLNSENGKKSLMSFSDKIQKKENSLKEKNKIDHFYIGGIYKLLSSTKKLITRKKSDYFKAFRQSCEVLGKYILDYKIINQIFRNYIQKRNICCNLILKEWIGKLKS